MSHLGKGLRAVQGWLGVKVTARMQQQPAARSDSELEWQLSPSLASQSQLPFTPANHSPPPSAAGMSRGSHLQQLQRFVKEVAQLEDVYFVTMRQLLAWMKVRASCRSAQFAASAPAVPRNNPSASVPKSHRTACMLFHAL